MDGAEKQGRRWKKGVLQTKKLACVREITQAKEVVPGTASIYGLCFSALSIITVKNAAVCDRILRIIPYQK